MLSGGQYNMNNDPMNIQIAFWGKCAKVSLEAVPSNRMAK